MVPDTSNHWHQEVPGTRWFRADLHLHTLDDPYVELPVGITGDRTDFAVFMDYARRFLWLKSNRKAGDRLALAADQRLGRRQAGSRGTAGGT